MIKVVTERNELQESYDKLLEEYDSLKKEIELSEKKKKVILIQTKIQKKRKRKEMMK